MGVFVDLTGRVYGRLTVLQRSGTLVNPNGRKKLTWLCRCICGQQSVIRGEKLRSGHTKSCGCLRREGPAPRRGEESPHWKGDEISYSSAHTRARVAKGSASVHPCVDCGSGAEDWSYIGGCARERISSAKKTMGCTYSPDPSRYVARCKPCHKKYDLAMEVA